MMLLAAYLYLVACVTFMDYADGRISRRNPLVVACVPGFAAVVAVAVLLRRKERCDALDWTLAVEKKK